jgi:chromate reductase
MVMNPPFDVAVFVGSLRKASLNRKMALALMSLAPAELRLEAVEIGSLPLYDEDAEASPPVPWQKFRERVRRADAALFVTPEYNRSIPGLLKNAIDVGSRPYGKSVWSRKPAAVVSVSPGAIGGFGANQHLRQCFVFLDMPALQQPEAYVGNGAALFGDDGQLTKPGTREFLSGFMQAFADWVGKHAPAR